MANEYLTRTPTSSGNQKVWTLSAWIKTNDITGGSGNGEFLFGYHNDTGSTPRGSIQLNESAVSGRCTIGWNPTGTSWYQTKPEGLYRDSGNWHNIVVSVDTTKEDEGNGAKIYFNGIKKENEFRIGTWGSGAASLNTDTGFNSNTDHFIGAFQDSLVGSNYQIFDLFWVDGQALTPDVFGFYKDGDGYQSSGTTKATDFRPGQWSPRLPKSIKYTINRSGGFGANGFYLPMNDSSNPGADFHCTPNSIITLKGEDLPQPQNGAPTTSDAYVSQLRSDPFAANLVLAVPGISTATGANLVTNGTFEADSDWQKSSHWNISGGSASMPSTSNYLPLYQYNLGMTAGVRYTASIDVTAISGSIKFDTSNSTGGGIASTEGIIITTTGTHSISFTADANEDGIGVARLESTTSSCTIDNIVVKQENTPRDYSADIKGSGSNKTLTAAGSAGVGYGLGGYYGSAMTFDNDGTNSTGNTDVINVPDSDDFYFTGDVTMEGWICPKGTPSTASIIFGQWLSGGGTDRNFNINFDTSRQLIAYFNSSATNYNTGTSPVLALNQWYHVAAEKYGSVFTLYVNGVAVAVNDNTPTAGNNSTVPFTIGSETDGSNGADYGFDGEIQDVRVYKGVAKYKGGFDVPKPYTPVGIEAFRTTADTCKNNFATWNPLLGPATTPLADGNLSVTNNGVHKGTRSTIGVTSGKWYWEYRVGSVVVNSYVGVSHKLTSDGFSGGDHFLHGTGNNNYADPSGSFSETNGSFTTGMIIGCAFDYDAGTLDIYKNGTLAVEVTGGDFVGKYIHAHISFNASFSDEWVGNFGQNPSFNGKVTAGTNADDSGKGLFKYAPPTGFLALCEDNLPTPAIADPGDYFKTVLWTGEGSAGRSITGVGFQPDMVWVKRRDGVAVRHYVFDSIRGPLKALDPSDGIAEVTSSTWLQSFDSNGFAVGTSSGLNGSGNNYVAWCWKAGGPAVTNNEGDITTQVSANPEAGFSIVRSPGPGTSGHGLNSTPKFIIQKSIGTGNWNVSHVDLYAPGGTGKILLNLTDPVVSSSTTYLHNATATTFDPLFSGDQIAYVWAEVEGFSKFGSYVGNNSADGPFVYCGFKPAWVMVKRITTGGNEGWPIYDSSRGPSNPNPKGIYANSDIAEGDASGRYKDFLSNGFKIRGNSGEHNSDGITYIFAAFAESPFQTANAK